MTMIKIAIADDLHVEPKGDSHIFNLPFGGACEEEIQDLFDDVIYPVVEALIESKRLKLESEFEDEED